MVQFGGGNVQPNMPTLDMVNLNSQQAPGLIRRVKEGRQETDEISHKLSYCCYV